MILGYRDKRTRDFASGESVKALSGIEHPARMKLHRMESASSVQDLAALPGNRFEALKGDRKRQFSVRINDQWRISNRWPASLSGPSDVEIVDYH